MANKLPGAVGNAAGNGLEQRFVKYSRNHNAERAVGRGKSFAVDGLAKLSGDALQDPHFRVALPKAGPLQKLAGPQGQAWPQGIAHRPNATGCRRPQQGPQDSWEQVCVLVGVEV